MKVRRDDRIALRGTDLLLESVGEADGGEYSCEIEADQEYPVAIAHTVEVLSECTRIVETSHPEFVTICTRTVVLVGQLKSWS